MQSERKRLISDSAAIRLLGISPRTFYRYMQAGTITAPSQKLGKNRRGWTMQDIDLARNQIQEMKQTK